MTASMSSDLSLIIKETKFCLNVLTFLCLELPLSTLLSFALHFAFVYDVDHRCCSLRYAAGCSFYTCRPGGWQDRYPFDQARCAPERSRRSPTSTGTVDLGYLVSALLSHSHMGLTFCTSKFANGFSAYKANTGEEHPLAAGFGFPPPPGGIGRRASKSAIPLQDDDGSLWQGSLRVGTPPQTYTVQMDTGSSDLFLPGPRCQSSCSGHRIYNPSASSTAVDRHRTFSLAYGGGDTVEGEQYLDTVSIAGLPVSILPYSLSYAADMSTFLQASGQTLGAASQYSEGFSADDFPPDGLLGMAYQSISDYNSPPLFQTLVAQKQVAQAVFAFKLSSSGSLLTLGGVDDTKYTGSITYAPVTTKVRYLHIILLKIANDPDNIGLLAGNPRRCHCQWKLCRWTSSVSHRHWYHPYYRRCRAG